MATRRLTDAFLLMRNNSIQTRQILAEQVSTYDPHRTLSTRSHAAVSCLRRFVISFLLCDVILYNIASQREYLSLLSVRLCCAFPPFFILVLMIFIQGVEE